MNQDKAPEEYLFDGWDKMPAWNADAEVFTEAELVEAEAKGDGSHLLSPDVEVLYQFIKRHYTGMPFPVIDGFIDELHDQWFEHNNDSNPDATAAQFVHGVIAQAVRRDGTDD